MAKAPIAKPLNSEPLREVPGTTGLEFGQEVTAYVPRKGKIVGYTTENGRTVVLVSVEPEKELWVYTPESIGGKTLGAD